MIKSQNLKKGLKGLEILEGIEYNLTINGHGYPLDTY